MTGNVYKNNRKLLQFTIIFCIYTGYMRGEAAIVSLPMTALSPFCAKIAGSLFFVTCPNYLCASWAWAKIHVRSFLHCYNMVFPLAGSIPTARFARGSQLCSPKSEDSQLKTWELQPFGHFSRGKKTQLMSLNADRLWKQCWCLTMT